MEFRLSASSQKALAFSAGIPPSLASFAIEGCDNHYATADFGSVVVSEYETGPFRLCYITIIVKKAVTLYYRPLAPLWQMMYALRGGWQLTSGEQLIILPRGQLNLLYTPPADYQLRFDQLHIHSLLSLHCSRQLLEGLAPSYTLLQDFLREPDLRFPAMIYPVNTAMGLEIKAFLQGLAEQGWARTDRPWLEARLSCLLLESLDRIAVNRLDPGSSLLPPYDMDKIQEAGEYLLENLDTNVTLVELARKVGINDYKLKKGFRRFFDMTVFEFLIRARMEKARQLLLETTLPVGEISLMLGYRNIANFSAAFRKYTGFPPSALKGKKKLTVDS